MRLNRIWNRTSDEMRADEMDEVRRKINSLTSDNHDQHFRRNTTIPIRRSTVLNDELASVLPTIIDSSRRYSDILQQRNTENQTSNSRRNSSYSCTPESRRNSNVLQDIMKELKQYEEDDIDNFSENNDADRNIINQDNNQIDTGESYYDNSNIEEEKSTKKTLFFKQIKKMLCKSCSIGLKAGVLLLGHILLSIFKVLAFI